MSPVEQYALRMRFLHEMGYTFFDIPRLTRLEMLVLQLGDAVYQEIQGSGQESSSGSGTGQTRSQREQSKAVYREHFYGDE